MRIYFLLKDILTALVYSLFSRIVPPENEQDAQALYDLSDSLLFDPLNITKKGKQS
jgi:hypothetical protein